MMLLTALTATASAADLETTLVMPLGHLAYEEQTVEVDITNQGPGQAKDVSLTIQLPETNTTTVQVMGELGAFDPRCIQSGTQLDCTLGRLKAGKTAIVYVDIRLPWSAIPLDFEATASTSSSDTNPANDSAYDSAEVLYEDLVITAPASAHIQHCTGTDLTAFYECTLYPSSVSAHDHVFESDGSISFVNQSGYGGSWSQPTDDALWFEYTYNGDIIAELEGNAVDADCFEGLMTFPALPGSNPWVAPYEVCLQ